MKKMGIKQNFIFKHIGNDLHIYNILAPKCFKNIDFFKISECFTEIVEYIFRCLCLPSMYLLAII